MTGTHISKVTKVHNQEKIIPGVGSVLFLERAETLVVFPPTSIKTHEVSNVWKTEFGKLLAGSSDKYGYVIIALRGCDRPEIGLRDLVVTADAVSRLGSFEMMLSNVSGPMLSLLRQRDGAVSFRFVPTWDEGVMSLVGGKLPPLVSLKRVS